MRALLIFVATLAIGVKFNLPKKTLLLSSTIAATAFFLVHTLIDWGATEAEAAFAGSFFVALSAEYLAKTLKVPAPVISIPGIIPLVPGSVAYSAVISFLKKEETLGLETGTKALFIAVAIASGLLLAGALNRKFLRPDPRRTIQGE